MGPVFSPYGEMDRTVINIRQCNNGYIVYLPPPSPEMPMGNQYSGLIQGMKEVVKMQKQGDLGLPDEEPETVAQKRKKNFEFEVMKNVYIFTNLDGLIDFLKLTLFK